MPVEIDQWSSSRDLFRGTKPLWIADQKEQARIQAYDLFEAIYWCVPDTFRIQQRGTDSNPIYLPAGRVIVETLNRYLAPQMQLITEPGRGQDLERELSDQVLQDLVRRERFYSKFNANKRYGIIRGDWMFHLHADPNLPAGSRISVFPLDPSSVFPIYKDDNLDVILGYHITDEYHIEGDSRVLIRRTTYRKTTGEAGPSSIEVTDEVYEVSDWGGPGMPGDKAPVKVLAPKQVLPSPIDHLPVYHIQNFSEPGTIWGSSEMRGLERIMTAMNQTISDEELALALEGLGVYVTDAGTPVDENGQETAWTIAPGRVVELPTGKTMNRLDGIDSVQPNMDHMEFLKGWLEEATGANGTARGDVDVQAAESGIALYLRLAPLFSRVDEREQVVTDVLTNMAFDLPKWYVAYEGSAFNSLMESTRWIPRYGPRIPQNRQGEIDNLLKLAGAQPAIVPMSYIRQKLRSLGYDDLPEDDEAERLILHEAEVAQDAQGTRIQEEIDTVNRQLGEQQQEAGDEGT